MNFAVPDFCRTSGSFRSVLPFPLFFWIKRRNVAPRRFGTPASNVGYAKILRRQAPAGLDPGRPASNLTFLSPVATVFSDSPDFNANAIEKYESKIREKRKKPRKLSTGLPRILGAFVRKSRKSARRESVGTQKSPPSSTLDGHFQHSNLTPKNDAKIVFSPVNAYSMRPLYVLARSTRSLFALFSITIFKPFSASSGNCLRRIVS